MKNFKAKENISGEDAELKVGLDNNDVEIITGLLADRKKKISDEFWLLRGKGDKVSQTRSWALGDELEYMKCLINRRDYLDYTDRVVAMLDDIELGLTSDENKEIKQKSSRLETIDWQIAQKEKELADLKKKKMELQNSLPSIPKQFVEKDKQISRLRQRILDLNSGAGSHLKNHDDLLYFREFILNYVDDLKTRDFNSHDCRISFIPSAILLEEDKAASENYREIKEYLKSIAKGEQKYPEGIIELADKLEGTRICRDLYHAVLFRAGLLDFSIGDVNGGNLYWGKIKTTDDMPDWRQIEKEVAKIEKIYNLQWPYEFKVSDIEIIASNDVNYPRKKDLELLE